MDNQPPTCGQCVHYQPVRDRVTTRVLSVSHGHCAWRPDIKWSRAFRLSPFGHADRDPIVLPCRVGKYTDATTCPQFKRKDEVSYE
jgi:hypothetical protein